MAVQVRLGQTSSAHDNVRIGRVTSRSGHVRRCQSQVRSDHVSSGQNNHVMSYQVRSDQVRPKPGHVMLDQFRSLKVMSCQVRSVQVRSGKATDSYTAGQSHVRLCQIRSGHVTFKF